MPTAKEIMASAKNAVLAVQPDLDKSLTTEEQVAVTDAAANYLSTVNPTIKTYPPTIPSS